MKICILILVSSVCAGVLGTGNKSFRPAKPVDSRPNIVLIMADDLGFSDIGCYGGEIKTPNLDRLAANGIRFSQFYNTSRCCPTRASLLTGLYNHQAGVGHMTTDQRMPGYRGYLTQNTVTVAEVLKDAGYHTGMVGKWHVSNTIVQPDAQQQLKWLNHNISFPIFSPIPQYPVSRGFEKFYGTLWGVIDFFDPFSLINGSEAVQNVPANYYHTDALNDSAVSYIRQFSKEKNPFFIYVAHNAPHWPIQALPEDINKYRDTYVNGWEPIREARYKKLVNQGMINPRTGKLPPAQNLSVKWSDNKDKAWDAHAMAVHAAMIDRMDQGIGRIISSLKETGELDNTLILFLSDNGASPEVCAKFGAGFDRPGETRSGEKIVYPVGKEVLPGPQTVFASIGPEWASVANTPYRFWKIESHEGGIHTPLIAHWPKVIRQKGGITDQAGHVMDFMATFVEIARTRYPSQYKGNSITPIDGLSLVPVFKGQQRTGHPAIFNEHEDRRYVRKGNWKMVSAGAGKEWQLYNLNNDGTETTDVSGQYPGKITELNNLWQQWATQHNVLPGPGKR